MPTTSDGLHYLDDPRELLALINNWTEKPEFVDLEGPVKLLKTANKFCYASLEAIKQAGFRPAD